MPDEPEAIVEAAQTLEEQINTSVVVALSQQLPGLLAAALNPPEPKPEVAPIPAPTSQAEQITKRVAHALATGSTPKQALKAGLDADGDGKVGVRDLRVMRWMLVIFVTGVFLGTLLMNPLWPVWVITNHWPIVVACIIAFPAGIGWYWLFRPDIDKHEDKIINYLDAGLNNIL